MTWHAARRVVIAEPPAGKPSIAVLSNGDIVVSYIRNYQIAGVPQSETMEVIRSSDGGKSWSRPVRATVSNHNDREGYLIRFDDDTLLLCYMRVMAQAEPDRPWQGPYLTESTDGGRTWSRSWQVDIASFCPQGPYGAGDRGHVVLPDGTLLLFVSTYVDPPQPYEYVMISHDRGRTFDEVYPVANNSGDGSFCLAPDGSIAGALRINADNWPHRDAHPELRQQSECVHFLAYTRSQDQGKTWAAPQPITGYNEIPGHLLALRDGRLLLSFGVRHYPLGIQAMLTDLDGRWNLEERYMLAWNGGQYPLGGGYARHTIGHPFTAQLPAGTLMTAYYRLANPFDGHSCQIEALFWDPPAAPLRPAATEAPARPRCKAAG
ncbi:MAG TPA: sialidase family protein [Phycisphaeraceae bacterium]